MLGANETSAASQRKGAGSAGEFSDQLPELRESKQTNPKNHRSIAHRASRKSHLWTHTQALRADLKGFVSGPILGERYALVALKH
jgi:hypothetical protein